MFRKESPAPSSDSKSKSYIDIHNTYYAAARSELVQRIQLRDQSFIAYLTITGGYFAYILTFFDQHKTLDSIVINLALLVPLPFICVCLSLVIIQHHILIGTISYYIRSELVEEMRAHTGIMLTSWDTSSALEDIGDRSYLFRFFAQCTALAVPNCYILVYVYQNISIIRAHNNLDAPLIILITLELMSAAFIVYIHSYAHMLRKRLALSSKKSIAQG